MPQRAIKAPRNNTKADEFRRAQQTFRWWRGLDSNQRTRKRADLQSAAINHSATSPANLGLCHALATLDQLAQLLAQEQGLMF
jgi:hypothetical protein